MIFGKNTVSTDYGAFESDCCSQCGAKSYRLVCKNDYLVFLRANAFPIGACYETVCESCGDVRSLQKQAGRDAAKRFFAEKHRCQSMSIMLKIAAVAAFVLLLAALPLLLSEPAMDPDFFKGLVDEDGLYSIQNFDGEELCIINVQSGEKLVTLFGEKSTLVGEPGADGSFIKHDYYTESTNKTGDTVLERSTDSPGFLKDRHGMIVRQYSYNKKTGALGYMRGVEDLSAIKYEPGKAVYPFSFYIDGSFEPKPVTYVLHMLDDKRIELMFTDETTLSLVTITVSEYENGRIRAKKAYYFEPETDAVRLSGLTPESAARDFLEYIDTQKPAPIISHAYTYYKDSHVFSSISIDGINSAGEMQNFEQHYDVTENGRFYIQTLK
ncbi:MAG: hypothetical protein WDA65_05370 [Christensenellales bacterium]